MGIVARRARERRVEGISTRNQGDIRVKKSESGSGSDDDDDGGVDNEQTLSRQWVQVQGHRTTGGKASRPGQAPTHSGRRLARRNVTQMKAFESDKKGSSSSSSSFSRSLAVAGLSAMLL